MKCPLFWDTMPVIGWFIPDVSRQHSGLSFKALNVQEHWEPITQWQSIISQKKRHILDYRLLNSQLNCHIHGQTRKFQDTYWRASMVRHINKLQPLCISSCYNHYRLVKRKFYFSHFTHSTPACMLCFSLLLPNIKFYSTLVTAATT